MLDYNLSESFKFKASNFVVKKEKLLQFQEFLKEYGGYFASNPIFIDDEWRVNFVFYNNRAGEFIKAWNQINTQVIEKTKKKSLFQRLKNLFK